MNTYRLLDDEITQAVRVGAHPLYASKVRTEAHKIAQTAGHKETRLINDRLQALRLAGKITADPTNDGSWSLNN